MIMYSIIKISFLKCYRLTLKLLVLTFIHGEVALPDERLKSSRGSKPAASHASLAMSFIPLVLVLAMAAQTATRNPQCQPSLTKVTKDLHVVHLVLLLWM
jgi:hypothetical protein